MSPDAGTMVDFSVSANAARRISELAAAEAEQGAMLRLTVNGGGCSGFQYSFDFDSSVNEDDQTFHRDGATVVIDEVSLELLKGSEIDFVEDLLLLLRLLRHLTKLIEFTSNSISIPGHHDQLIFRWILSQQQ